jgi:cytochrome c-type biogenesis protein CcmH
MARFPLYATMVTLVAVVAVTALTWSGRRGVPPSAKALEATLLAPCCWSGTLATHESPLASELREEIESRAAKGETTEAIEADMVTRYGERVRAMPSAGAFSNAIVIVIDLLLLAMGGLAVILFRWRRGHANALARRTPATEATKPTRDALDDRIDAELAEL